MYGMQTVCAVRRTTDENVQMLYTLQHLKVSAILPLFSTPMIDAIIACARVPVTVSVSVQRWIATAKMQKRSKVAPQAHSHTHRCPRTMGTIYRIRFF